LDHDSAPPQPPPEDGSFFTSEKWAAIFESLLKLYGSGVVHELYGPNGKIRKFCESHRFEAMAYQQNLPPYFRQLFRPLGWWPSDFLRVAGPTAWDYQPFWLGVRILHVRAELPCRSNQSPVLLPGLTGRSRLEIADDARPWDEFKQLPDAFQGALLGWSIPLYGDAGNDDDALHKVAAQAREELKRFLKVERDLLREKRPHASLRHLRTLRLFEWLREEGKSWEEAEELLATRQGRTPTAIHGDVQRAMRALKLTRQELDDTLGHRERAGSEMAKTDQQEPCPIHGKPVDGLMTCSDCRNEAKADSLPD
jgi:hypothetical protein